MKQQRVEGNKKSLRAMNRLAMYLIPLVIGLCLFLAETMMIVSDHQRKQAERIDVYEAQIRNRMQEEVVKAVQIAEYYYRHNKETLSTEAIQLAVVELLEQLHSEDVGYFFAADYQGNNQLGPSKGNNFFEIEDKNGLKVVQELIRASRNGGGFVTYVMPPLEGVEQVPKISFVLPFDPFGWYIGAGVNLSEIEIIKTQIREQTIQESVRILLVTAFIIGILMVLFRQINLRLYQKIEKEVHKVVDYLDKSVSDTVPLEPSELNILEMEQIARHSVRMVEKRNADKEALEDINQSLEEEIAEHAATIEMLDISRTRVESIVATVPDNIFIMDRDGTFLDTATGDRDWMGMSRNGMIGRNVREVLPEAVAASCVMNIQEALRTHRLRIHEFQLGTGDDVEYYEVRITTFQPGQVFTIVRDVSESKKFQLTNEYLSYHDQLTGTFNRRYFEEALIRLDRSEHLPIAMAMVDVNGLKMTNDAFGHRTGDKVLCVVAEILQRNCTLPLGFVARIGGDEFAMISPNTNPEHVTRTIEKIHDEINKVKEGQAIVSISIGWEIKTEPAQSMTELFNRAEAGMYQRKLTESQSVHNQAVQAIMKTLNEKNAREKRHSERVSKISRLIGAAMNLDYTAVKELETAGLLHDIGKIVVDQNILDKEGRLDEEEYDKIKKHPESSYQILKSINAYAGLAEDVLSHHERLDGSGYPRRLKGEEIPLAARIISIADAYEAMTADRAYRSAMSGDTALEELRRHAGTQFDPDIVEVFADKVFAELRLSEAG